MNRPISAGMPGAAVPTRQQPGCSTGQGDGVSLRYPGEHGVRSAGFVLAFALVNFIPALKSVFSTEVCYRHLMKSGWEAASWDPRTSKIRVV